MLMNQLKTEFNTTIVPTENKTSNVTALVTTFAFNRFNKNLTTIGLL